MQYKEICKWIKEEESREKVLMALKMPLTAKLLARKTGMSGNACSYIIAKFSEKGIVYCLNPKARNSRLYWLAEVGRRCQKQLCREKAILYQEYDISDADWVLFGWVCFSHRSVVIRILNQPMYPGEIRRYIRKRQPDIKINAGNIQDVIKLFLAKRIVQPVKIKKRVYPRYELTDLGYQLKQLLIQAESLN